MPESRERAHARAPMVLHVRVVTGTGGGPEKTILNSPRYLAELGYVARCAYLHPPDDAGFAEIRNKAQRCGAPLDEVPDRGPLDWRVIPALLRICKRHDVRIWHGHDYKSNVLGVLLARIRPMRLVTTVHGWGVQDSMRAALYYAVDRLSLRYFQRVICVSSDLQETCRAAGVRPDRCALIENAIDAEAFRRVMPCERAKREHRVAAGRLVIGAVGRLSAEKRFIQLVRIVRRLLATGLDAELWIVGDGPERSRLESAVQELAMESRVRLLGYRPDVGDLLQAMDVLAIHSLREGLPNVLLEAMACEVPVVATDVGGIGRVIANRRNGMLVDYRDRRGFEEALAALASDAELRRAISRAGRATIEGRYSFDVRMQRVAAIYDEVLGESSAVRGAVRPSRKQSPAAADGAGV